MCVSLLSRKYVLLPFHSYVLPTWTALDNISSSDKGTTQNRKVIGNILRRLKSKRRVCIMESRTCTWILPSGSYPILYRQLREGKICGLPNSNPLHHCAGAVTLGMVFIPMPWYDGLQGWGQSRWTNTNIRAAERGSCTITGIWALVYEERKMKRKRMWYRKGLSVNLTLYLKFCWTHQAFGTSLWCTQMATWHLKISRF